MLLEIGLVAAGVPVGWSLRKSRTAQAAVGHILTWVVRLLLLVLGIALGGDHALMSQLENLGLQAAVISLSSVGGSLLVARLLEKRLDLNKPDPSREA